MARLRRVAARHGQHQEPGRRDRRRPRRPLRRRHGAVLADPNVDQVLVILTPQSMTDIEAIARGICAHPRAGRPSRSPARSWARPTWAAGSASSSTPASRITSCRNGPAGRWPTCSGSARGASSRPTSRAACRSTEPRPAAIIDSAPAGYLAEDQALAVLAAYGLPGAAVPALHERRRGGGVRRAGRLSRRCCAW